MGGQYRRDDAVTDLPGRPPLGKHSFFHGGAGPGARSVPASAAPARPATWRGLARGRCFFTGTEKN